MTDWPAQPPSDDQHRPKRTIGLSMVAVVNGYELDTARGMLCADADTTPEEITDLVADFPRIRARADTFEVSAGFAEMKIVAVIGRSKEIAGAVSAIEDPADDGWLCIDSFAVSDY